MSILSICLPVFNAEKYVGDTLQSLIPVLTNSNCELIIVDDGSTDETMNVVNEQLRLVDASKIRIFHQNNLGSATARNRAIEESKGEWIYFLDSDDMVQSSNLLKAIGYLDKSLAPIIRTGWINLNSSQHNLDIDHKIDDIPTFTYMPMLEYQKKMQFMRAKGFWRYFYRTSLIQSISQPFYPTFWQAGGTYIQDDYYFLINLSSSVEGFMDLGITTYLYRDRKEGLSKKYLAQLKLEGKVLSDFIISRKSEIGSQEFFTEECFRRFSMISKILTQHKIREQSLFRLPALIILLKNSRRNIIRRSSYVILYYLKLAFLKLGF